MLACASYLLKVNGLVEIMFPPYTRYTGHQVFLQTNPHRFAIGRTHFPEHTLFFEINYQLRSPFQIMLDVFKSKVSLPYTPINLQTAFILIVNSSCSSIAQIVADFNENRSSYCLQNGSEKRVPLFKQIYLPSAPS